MTQSLHRALQQGPDRTMTVCGDRVRTVREVAGRVARLAGGLRGLGVGPGDRVAVLAPNSDHHHEAFYATWWLGAVVNPLNTRWNADELARALDDSGATALLVGPEHLAVGRELHARCPQLKHLIGLGTADAEVIAYEDLVATSAPVADTRTGGGALAALLYTGGTTSAPKGVMASHQSMLISSTTTQLSSRSALPGGVTLVTAPLFHIAGIGGWLAQNSVGGTQVFLPAFSAEAVLDAVDRHRVSTMALVPTMLQAVVDHPERPRYDLASVYALHYGASPISGRLLARAMSAFPGAGFTQGYGMTETAGISVLGRQEHAHGGPRLRSAGRATPYCDVRIAAPDGGELPVGEAGEILVRGDNVMLGYWNRPEETAETIRDGWLHTGDIGHLDQDGYLYVVDRLKDMIITGGENVYTPEVENAVARHPAVAACAVVGLPDERWGERVHAAVVLRAGASASAEEIREHARGLLAGYKVPRSVEFLDALPLSGAGKVLKTELRDRAARAVPPADDGAGSASLGDAVGRPVAG